MRITLAALAFGLVTGCSFTPPKPKQCEGEFRPVNTPAQQGSTLMSQAESLALCTKGAGNGLQG